MKNILFLLLISSIVYAQKVEPLSREALDKLYKELYLPGKMTEMPWKGDAENCDAGKLDTAIYKKAADRINFFRKIYGLQEVSINAEFSKKAQAAALLSKASEQLTHEPTKSMKCFSEAASEGCQKSCLGFVNFEYFPNMSFLTGFMQDYGEANYFVGHRRWMLYSKLEQVGYGATDNSEALYTVDGVNFETEEAAEYIAYPWPGCVPNHLIFPKWSFSIPEHRTVDFSQAVVSMKTAAGEKIDVELLPVLPSYLDHTLVWSVKSMFDYSDGEPSAPSDLEDYLDKKIKVQIRNVIVDGKKTNFEYEVIPVRM